MQAVPRHVEFVLDNTAIADRIGHGLWRGFAAARLLGLQIRIPLGAWLFLL